MIGHMSQYKGTTIQMSVSQDSSSKSSQYQASSTQCPATKHTSHSTQHPLIIRQHIAPPPPPPSQQVLASASNQQVAATNVATVAADEDDVDPEAVVSTDAVATTAEPVTAPPLMMMGQCFGAASCSHVSQVTSQLGFVGRALESRRQQMCNRLLIEGQSGANQEPRCGCRAVCWD